jgi:chromosomal replication initiation ATPase DnaA
MRNMNKLVKVQRSDFTLKPRIYTKKVYDDLNVTTTQSKVFQTVCEYYNVSELEVLGKSKIMKYAQPRQIIQYILRFGLKIKIIEIAKIFNQRISAPQHNFIAVQNLLETNKQFKKEFGDIISKL